MKLCQFYVYNSNIIDKNIFCFLKPNISQSVKMLVKETRDDLSIWYTYQPVYYMTGVRTRNIYLLFGL